LTNKFNRTLYDFWATLYVSTMWQMKSALVWMNSSNTYRVAQKVGCFNRAKSQPNADNGNKTSHY